MNILAVVAFVVLVNAACIVSFSRAERALRELGAAWVRSLARPPRGTTSSTAV